MKVYFFPPTSPFNPYIDNVVNGLEEAGVSVVNKKATNKYTKLLSSFGAMLQHTDVYHLNWIENKSSVDTKKNRLICKAILSWLKMMKLSGGKLVWTMHNLESHFCKGDKTFHYNFMNTFISRMDMIVVHAKETAEHLINKYNYPEDQICYVPHGSYIQNANVQVPQNEAHEGLVFLAFGMVNRYKNVPMLVRAFRSLNMPDAYLKIYGKCDEKDSELLREITMEVAATSNVMYENAFVPEDKVDSIFAQSDIVVLPYDKQSMINSGAVVKAFSEAKPIVVSRFGAVKDIEERSFVHCYDYTDDKEHYERLQDALKQAYQRWNEQKNIFEEEGKEAFVYSRDELSWENICKTIVEYYQRIK